MMRLSSSRLSQAQTQLKFANDLYQRRNNLWKENIGTEVDLTTAKNNVDQAQHQIEYITGTIKFYKCVC